jgi:hypothetical protein
MKKCMEYIKTLIFGVRAQGEPVALPKFKTTMPKNRPTEDQWAKEFNFGSRYGHRGSYYERR